jgi:tetratricopeptide (TPR) repeat protein
MLLLLRDGSPERAVRDLGRVTTLPESPTGLILAAEGSEGDSLLAEGLRAYEEGDHAEAARELTASIRTGGDTLPAAFYLGASLLAENRFSEAIEAYRNVIASGDTVYESASRYYLAKALLREGRAEEALESLGPVERGAGEMSLRASSLADSITKAARR